VDVVAEDAVASRSYRAELTTYCRRMLGSSHEAEDAVQETLLRAWRASRHLEHPASVRAWLYRIATNVCLDALGRAARRPAPVSELPEPIDACREPGPSDRALGAEDLRLALLAMIGSLPPRQRAVLVLRDVLSWHAAETAELLGMTGPAVNSALQRAHASLRAVDLEHLSDATEAAERETIARYLAAFADDDIDALIAFCKQEAGSHFGRPVGS
jgi:RNA polymerase sigma-70 factor, ECF subfamily